MCGLPVQNPHGVLQPTYPCLFEACGKLELSAEGVTASKKVWKRVTQIAVAVMCDNSFMMSLQLDALTGDFVLPIESLIFVVLLVQVIYWQALPGTLGICTWLEGTGGFNCVVDPVVWYTNSLA